jgi:hypothetical protein
MGQKSSIPEILSLLKNLTLQDMLNIWKYTLEKLPAKDQRELKEYIKTLVSEKSGLAATKVAYRDAHFGEIAVKMGFITREKLLEALNTQIEENLTQNHHRLLGQILLANGTLTADQVDQVLSKLFSKK